MERFRPASPTLLSSLCCALLTTSLACSGEDVSDDDGDSDTTGADSDTTASASTSGSATATATGATATATATTTGTTDDTDDTSTTGATGDTGDTDDTDDTDDTSTTGDDRILVPVGHPRELRGAWVASVFNINFPSEPGLSAAAQEEELLDILDTMESAGLNAAFLQVRPESDALYPSQLEPWSRSLTGTQGQDPGWDPLEVAIDEAHARGIELHAWLNPYRAKASLNSELAPPHVALAHPEHAHTYGSYLWMDPGSAEVQDHLLAVIDDLVSRYDIDGIHFDDYFYPYPTDDPFPDDLTWSAYEDGGGELDRDDWRRHNVDTMVEAVGVLVAELRPEVRFGISPFGIYRPGIPAGISGFDQYEGLYADPIKWIDAGWLDYLAPQLYWPTTYPKQAYDVLISWWAGATSGGRHIFAGNYLSKLGSGPEWSLDEFLTQIELTRAESEAGARGNIYFSVEPILSDWEGFAGILGDDLYAEPALTPAIAAAVGDVIDPPELNLDAGVVTLNHGAPGSLRAYSIYFSDGDAWVLDRLVPAAEATTNLSQGTWAIAAAAKTGVESLGVVIEVP